MIVLLSGTCRRRGFALLVLICAIGFYLAAPWVQRKVLYPFDFRPSVERAAVQQGIDPLLVAAVIRTESKFSPRVHSPRGAVGLMQLMPDTARWIAGELGEPFPGTQALENPEVNIRYGVWYLRSLQQEFSGNEMLVLAAYNAGRGNVQQWMAEYGWTESFADPDQLPFGETRSYVKKVLAARTKYRALYDESR